ncbi:phage minor head protein [Escherichia marmotae]|nr:phage minor head protein [Escherichia marmotae]HAI8714147.1 phage head morphogenesis protein [Escherichia coli]MEC9626141.1 phage minor head protein [Escherichia marmotae]MED0363739.1 phage minor head protein [Escherichia marmotae]MED8777110.1 phage minor head protein [Escherichia marmotae]MED9200622.1 phage minor head protein [Escherichia marmotae]
MRRDIEWRYHGIKTDLRELFDSQFSGRQVAGNSQKSALICNNDKEPPSLFWVNSGEYQYELDGADLARLFQRTQEILDAWLLDGGPDHIWTGEFIAAEYGRGTQSAFTSLARQSEDYARQTTLSELLFSPEYQRRVGIAYLQSYSHWKGISSKAQTDLANVISDVVARGINPRATARIVSDRLDVSMSRAFNMAQTEQVGAYRQAIWDETEDVQKRLGMRTALLWLSALKPTTRAWHASRHGKTYSIDEVKAFYAKDGNRWNCYCSQQPILVDAQGKPLNTALVERLYQERNEWIESLAA